jgi:hypothetical protein
VVLGPDWEKTTEPSLQEVKLQKPKHPRSAVDVGLPARLSDQFVKDLMKTLDKLDQSFKVQYLRGEILSKFLDESVCSAEARRAAAKEKWLAVESRNSKTNQRIFHFDLVERDLGWITVDSLLAETAALVKEVLGPLRYPDVIQSGVHTNGASTRVRRRPDAALRKLTGSAHISLSAVKHWCAAFSGTRMSAQELTLQESSVFFTVPKKSEIDRVACKEPECNMLLQRSVGNHIRRRLKVYGIDLNDQTVNQRLAKEAVSKKLGTVDLSSASDTVSVQLVRSLLPADWFDLLDDLRVKSTLLDGELHELQMFSSMGNGFTFELESLLFYAITRVVMRRSGVRGRVSVYGDDIIAPVRVIPRLRRVFDVLGFVMNLKKTHYRGKFRESCGRHYWDGFDVTPFYIRRPITTLPDLVNHLNHVLEWNGRGWNMFVDEPMLRFWERWARYVPQPLWGGLCPRDATALVTGHTPRQRLTPITRATTRDPEAGLTYWLLCRGENMGGTPPHVLDPHFEDDDEPIEIDVSWLRGLKDPLVVAPKVEIGYRYRRIVSCGERTRWDPWGAFSPSRGIQPFGS